ncbi:MAG: N-acetyltransferase [Rhizobium sp.]|nr:N-acetyltransferase [Rhizobium sp.]
MIKIRRADKSDLEPLLTLYPEAFPDEDLTALVRDLFQAPEGEVLSLVATVGDQIVGHIAFTLCSVDGGPRTTAMLAPLAVAPAMQRRGIGKALIAVGMRLLEAAKIEQVLVLGDPRYYNQSGFSAEQAIAPPYPLPIEWGGAWQSIKLVETVQNPAGAIRLPDYWMKPALWAP